MKTASDDDGHHFKYRVSAVAIRGKDVLIHRAEVDDFWALPGGHVEMTETSEEALKREMKEELGVYIEVKRLLWVAENFFEYDGDRFHEVCFYYLIDLPDDSDMIKKDDVFYGSEGAYEYLGKEIELIFKWHHLHELDQIKFYPNFLVEALKDIPEHTEHIIHDSC